MSYYIIWADSINRKRKSKEREISRERERAERVEENKKCTSCTCIKLEQKPLVT